MRWNIRWRLRCSRGRKGLWRRQLGSPAPLGHARTLLGQTGGRMGRREGEGQSFADCWSPAGALFRRREICTIRQDLGRDCCAGRRPVSTTAPRCRQPLRVAKPAIEFFSDSSWKSPQLRGGKQPNESITRMHRITQKNPFQDVVLFSTRVAAMHDRRSMEENWS